MVKPRLQLIGAGQLGGSLGRLGRQSDVVTIDRVVCRSRASAEAAVAFIGSGRPTTRPPAPKAGDLWLLAVPDDVLPMLARDLAERGGRFDGVTVVHASGALSAAVLRPLSECGARTASVHPLRSFADPARAADDFAGTCCAVEGDAQALAILIPVFEAMGGRCLRIDGAAKTEYHAAAVLASNYLVALLEASLRLLERAGIDRETGLQMIAPLSRGSLENALRTGPAQALSGPILRGDADTVARQLTALAPLELDMLYRQLGHIALELARQRAQASPADLVRIGRLLAGDGET